MFYEKYRNVITWNMNVGTTSNASGMHGHHPVADDQEKKPRIVSGPVTGTNITGAFHEI